jgi:putative oxidoreductase
MIVAIGRLLLGALFVVSGVNKIIGWQDALGHMQAHGFPTTDIAGYPLVQVLLVGTIALEVIGGLMVITGLGAKPAAVALAAFTLVSGVIFHNFWAVTEPGQFTNQFNHFLKNVAIIGGLLVVAGQPRGVVRTTF